MANGKKTCSYPLKCQKFVGKTLSDCFSFFPTLLIIVECIIVILLSPHVGILHATAQSGLTGALRTPFLCGFMSGISYSSTWILSTPVALLCSWTLCSGSTSTRRVWSSRTWWRSRSALGAPGWPQWRRVKKWLTPSYSWSCGSTVKRRKGNDNSWPSSCQSHKSLHRCCLAEFFQTWGITMHTTTSVAQHRVALNTHRK